MKENSAYIRIVAVISRGFPSAFIADSNFNIKPSFLLPDKHPVSRSDMDPTSLRAAYFKR